MRLRCEALKLPASGKIDVPIQCENARKRHHQEEEGESSKKMATDATGQEHIAEDPIPGKGKGKVGNGLKAKTARPSGERRIVKTRLVLHNLISK
jgi:hypothetical protein